jgi:hypothetical protein
MPGHVWLPVGGVEPVEEPGVLGVVDPDVPDVPEPDVPEPDVPEPDVPEPELVEAALGVVDVDPAAEATVVPTPARRPDSNRPAATCFVLSFIVIYLVSCMGPLGPLDLAVGNRGPTVK